MKYSYPLGAWKKIFREFQQVKRVEIDTSDDRLSLLIRSHSAPLYVTRQELENIVSKLNCNPKEAATSFLKEHGVIVYYQNTLVGFFDIVGYSSFIPTPTFAEKIDMVSIFFKQTETLKANMGRLKIAHWILSDSVILALDTNHNPLCGETLKWFLATCSSLMTLGIRSKFPLRGAIGGGDFYKDGEIMVSTALVDAHKYEKEQDWLGAVLTPNALAIVAKANRNAPIDLTTNEYKDFVGYRKIPWKKNEWWKCKKPMDYLPEQTFCLKPYSPPLDWVSYLPDYFDKEGRGREKVANSHCLYAPVNDGDTAQLAIT